MRWLVSATVCVSCALLAAGVSGHPLPGAPNCPIFPANNPWNQRVDHAPVAGNSASMISSIGWNLSIQPAFGSGYWGGAPNGVPYVIVSSRTQRVPVRFEWARESDGRRYPLPSYVGSSRMPLAGDHHVLVIDRDRCRDYELYGAFPHDGGRWWSAGAGAIFNLRSNRLRPRGWTAADPAGLPLLPGLARYSEVQHGSIDHALAFAAPCVAGYYIYPARHALKNCGDGYYPPFGLRVRLKASVSIRHLPRQVRVIARALKRYGMILTNIDSPWYILGTYSKHWSNSELNSLSLLRGGDFEVVSTRSLPHPH